MYAAVGTHLPGRYHEEPGPSVVFTSSNGFDWNEITFENDAGLDSIAYGNETHIGVGEGQYGDGVVGYGDEEWNEIIIKSADGYDWEEITGVIDVPLQEIVFGDGQFVALGNSSNTTSIYWTDEGNDWEFDSLSGDYTSPKIAYGNGKYLVYDIKNSAHANSQMQWLEKTSIFGENIYADVIGYVDGKFVGLCRCSNPEGNSNCDDDANYVITSEDTLDWEIIETTTIGICRDIEYRDGVYIAICDSKIHRSVNLKEWELAYRNRNKWMYDVVYGNDVVIAVGEETILISDDGLEWDETYE